MRSSNTKLDNAGRELINNLKNDQSYEMINEWRALHAMPLLRFRSGLYKYGQKRKKALMVAQRLKRMPTIINKLTRFPTINLSQMQDIGGIRAIVNNISEVEALRKYLKRDRRSDTFIEHNEKDYIREPKTGAGYGYRSIHIIYKYIPQDPQYENLKIELQIRTKLQHYWATAVEAFDVIKNQSLKSGIGNSEWLEFFALVSSLFALKEETAMFCEHVNKTRDEILIEFINLEKRLNAINTLKGIMNIPKNIETKVKNTQYCIIILNSETKETEIKEYKEDDIDQANAEYIAIEEKILTEHLPMLAVLVSVNTMKNLKKAYPSYFLDVTEFISELELLQL